MAKIVGTATLENVSLCITYDLPCITKYSNQLQVFFLLILLDQLVSQGQEDSISLLLPFEWIIYLFTISPKKECDYPNSITHLHDDWYHLEISQRGKSGYLKMTFRQNVSKKFSKSNPKCFHSKFPKHIQTRPRVWNNKIREKGTIVRSGFFESIGPEIRHFRTFWK